MSQIEKSLKARIHEITASIAAHTAELAAYENLLHIESARSNTPAEHSPNGAAGQTTPALNGRGDAVELTGIKFTGNKTTLVAEIVKSCGSAGASPKDIDRVFTTRKIKRSKNLVYNTLSYLASRNKLHRHEGRYYAVLDAPVSTSQDSSPTKTKRKLSPAGLRAIRAGVKKRWAAKRAFESQVGEHAFRLGFLGLGIMGSRLARRLPRVRVALGPGTQVDFTLEERGGRRQSRPFLLP